MTPYLRGGKKTVCSYTASNETTSNCNSVYLSTVDEDVGLGVEHCIYEPVDSVGVPGFNPGSGFVTRFLLFCGPNNCEPWNKYKLYLL